MYDLFLHLKIRKSDLNELFLLSSIAGLEQSTLQVHPPKRRFQGEGRLSDAKTRISGQIPVQGGGSYLNIFLFKGRSPLCKLVLLFFYTLHLMAQYIHPWE